MKKLTTIILTIVLTLSFVGCSNSPKTESAPKTPVVEKTAEPAVQAVAKLELPADIKDTGKGRIETVSASGSSEDGAVPFIYAAKDTLLEQIGFNAWEFDGSKLSYIFVDGVLNTKEQLGDTQISLDLKEDNLKVGTHKVEVTQYEDDKLDGKLVTYKVGSYEIKIK